MNLLALFRLVLVCLFLGSIPQAHAIPEANYRADYEALVAPFVRDHAVDGSFRGERGVTLRYRLFSHPQARGAVVVSNGYTENYQKYSEVAFDLYQAGYSVYLFDHRGQGNSDRLLRNLNLGYIDRFNFLVRDMHRFVNEVVRPLDPQLPLLLLAHSMGGAVGARYLETYPRDFTAAVLSAPMIGVQLGAWDPNVAKYFLGSLVLMGQGEQVAWGTKRFNPAEYPFEKNELTHSPARYQMVREAIRQNPGRIIEAPTNAWVLRAILGAEATLAEASRVQVPVLLFQAEKDTFVANPPQDEFCRRAPRCELERVPGAKHEVLMEQDSMREPALQRILNFFSANGGR